MPSVVLSIRLQHPETRLSYPTLLSMTIRQHPKSHSQPFIYLPTIHHFLNFNLNPLANCPLQFRQQHFMPLPRPAPSILLAHPLLVPFIVHLEHDLGRTRDGLLGHGRWIILEVNSQEMVDAVIRSKSGQVFVPEFPVVGRGEDGGFKGAFEYRDLIHR